MKGEKLSQKIIGNAGNINFLQKCLENNKVPQCLLLTGEVGTGKTTVAEILASEMEGYDVVEYNCAESTLAEVSTYIDNMFKFVQKRVYVLDEIGDMGIHQNKFKNHMNKINTDIYIFATTSDPNKLDKGLRSRFIELEMQPLDLDDSYKLFPTKDKKIVKLLNTYTGGLPREMIKIVNLDLGPSETKLFLGYVENNEMLGLISARDFTEYIKVLRNRKIDKNFVRQFKWFIFECVCCIQGVECDLDKEEKTYVKKNLMFINPKDLMKAVSKIKVGDVYSFIELFEVIGGNITVAVEEKEKSETIAFEESKLRDLSDEFVDDMELEGKYGVFKEDELSNFEGSFNPLDVE